MASKKKNSLPFDKRGWCITVQGRLLESEAYMSLMPQSKVLMTLLQMQWDNFKPVDYGIREASEKIPCAFNTTVNAFKQLQDRGFIELIEHSVFSSTAGSKARSWRLTWLPFKSEAPTNEWEKWTEKINFSVSNMKRKTG